MPGKKKGVQLGDQVTEHIAVQVNASEKDLREKLDEIRGHEGVIGYILRNSHTASIMGDLLYLRPMTFAPTCPFVPCSSICDPYSGGMQTTFSFLHLAYQPSRGCLTAPVPAQSTAPRSPSTPW